MAQALLTVNSEVPSQGPAVPVLAVFDNGAWEIAFDGDVDHIAETNPAFLAATPVHEILNELLMLFDEDPMEEVDDRLLLFVSLTIPTGAENEPVILIWEDGSTEIMDHGNAEALITSTDEAHNFVPLTDLFEELRSWLSYNHENLFVGDDDAFDYEEGLDD